VWILHVLFDDVVVETDHSVPLDPVLSVEKADGALGRLLEILKELLLLVREEVVLLLRHIATHATGLRKLLLELATLGLVGRVGYNITLPEVVEHLAWHFFKCLLRQHHRVVLKVSERHELDDIGSHLLAVTLRVERRLISIKLVHSAEIC